MTMNTLKQYLTNKQHLIIIAAIVLFVLVLPTVYLLSSHPSAHKQATYTLADTDIGSTLHVHKNDTVVIAVHTIDGLAMETHIDNLNVLQQQVKQPYDRSSGKYENRFVAVSPGTATITVLGRPVCKPNAACPQFIVAPIQEQIIVDR